MGMLGVVVALAVVGQATGCAIDEDERDARVVAAVACIVSQLCAANDDLLGNSNLGKSTMPLTDYIRRLWAGSEFTLSEVIASMIYFDRIGQISKAIVPTTNAHRAFLTCLLMASKVYNDYSVKNSDLARLGGISAPEMNDLERMYAKLIKFTLLVSAETYEDYRKLLAAHIEQEPQCTCQSESSVNQYRRPDSLMLHGEH
ncbi:hypothetical protein PBRA_005813 [Plasmodiophora brassicae]|uniref:Cyclin-like domain-containing protein n=1 Tax=Plasmodiophora brassicae TaxID=37360 RepID=A0A0G4IRC8_PLABS|nr:hypothetical protein PBRA_005813 [Plasmodiophora brassicae]